MDDNTPDHPYSLVRSADGRTAYVSGVLPYDTAGGLATERHAAIAAVLHELGARLESAGLGLRDVVKTTVFVTDLAWRDAINRAWYEAFPPPRPARTAVEVRRLPRNAAIELEAVAAVPLGVGPLPRAI